MDRLVLGIDAAWTPDEPSGVCLVTAVTGHMPKLLRVARSYAEFVSDRQPDWLSIPPIEENLGIPEVIGAVQICARAQPDVVALDIPLSPHPIRGRRTADDAVSVEYASRWAATHTPSAERPGRISAAIFQQLIRLGYQWMNPSGRWRPKGQIRCFLETYPHPVIVEMLA